MAFLADLVRPYLTYLIVGVAAASVAGGGFLALKIHYTNVGYNKAIAAIAAQDKEAIDAADQARDRVRACRDAGGVWDTTSGLCTGR